MHPFFAAYLWSSLIGGMMLGGSPTPRVTPNADAE